MYFPNLTIFEVFMNFLDLDFKIHVSSNDISHLGRVGMGSYFPIALENVAFFFDFLSCTVSG